MENKCRHHLQRSTFDSTTLFSQSWKYMMLTTTISFFFLRKKTALNISKMTQISPDISKIQVFAWLCFFHQLLSKSHLSDYNIIIQRHAPRVYCLIILFARGHAPGLCKTACNRCWWFLLVSTRRDVPVLKWSFTPSFTHWKQTQQKGEQLQPTKRQIWSGSIIQQPALIKGLFCLWRFHIVTAVGTIMGFNLFSAN